MNNEIIKIQTSLVQEITSEQAWHYGIIPKSVNGTTIELYIDENSANGQLEDELHVLLGKSVKFDYLKSDIIQKSLLKYYKKSVSQPNYTLRRRHFDKEDFLGSIISEAVSLECSDIHIEPSDRAGRVRLRIDGKLFERFQIASSEYPAIVNKIKILANLDIAEKRMPQDGRISYDNKSYKFDIRISIIPSLYGEKIVMRLLSRTAMRLDLENLGLDSEQLSDYLQGIKKPYGIILISGPTGSGKTTTLYATLNLLNSDDVNILTIEDPIEYSIDGINQVQLRENIGLTFTKALRTFLRQDPDIIMIGEIRDSDTAEIAIRAALTGHLVLSTIHTNTAWGVVTRLVDMGIPSYLIAATLNTAVAQRLVRKLCPKCKTRKPVNDSIKKVVPEAKRLKYQYVANGCSQCNDSGYKGRTAVFEIININKDMQKLIKSGDMTEYEVRKHITQTLREGLIKLFTEGVTSFNEIYPMLII